MQVVTRVGLDIAPPIHLQPNFASVSQLTDSLCDRDDYLSRGISPQQEAFMRTVTIVTVALFLATGLFFKSNTVANTEAIQSPTQSAMSIYDLHVGYPNMKSLPAQEAPLP
jgi:hypothetical protein